MECIRFTSSRAETEWAASSPEHRGVLFELGVSLWAHRDACHKDQTKAFLEVEAKVADIHQGYLGRQLLEAQQTIGQQLSDLNKLRKDLEKADRSKDRELEAERDRFKAELEAATARSHIALKTVEQRFAERDEQAKLSSAERLGKLQGELEAERERCKVALSRAERDKAIELEHCAARSSAQISKLQNELKAAELVTAERVGKVQAKLEDEEAKHATTKRASAAELSRTVEDVKRETAATFQQKIARLEAALETNATMVKDLQLVKDSLASMNARKSTVERGKEGEKRAEATLMTSFPGSRYVDTSGLTAHGDGWWRPWAGSEDAILVEVKNYASPLPQGELDKFRRDMKAQTGKVVGGMLVCYGCPAVPEHFSKVSFRMHDTVPVAVVCEAEDNFESAARAFVELVREVVAGKARELDSDASWRKEAKDLAVRNYAIAKDQHKTAEGLENSVRLSHEHATKAHKAAEDQVKRALAALDTAGAMLNFMGIATPAEGAGPSSRKKKVVA